MALLGIGRVGITPDKGERSYRRCAGWQKMFKRNLIFAIAVVAVVAAGAYSLWPATPPPKGEPLKVTMHLWPGYYHSFIAREKGFFEAEGVNVALKIVEDIDANIQAFVDGEADAAFGLQSDAMLLAAEGIPVKIVYVVDYSNGGDVVISKPSIRTISDLKGKRISVDKLNGFNHIFIAELLQLSGLTESDVEIIPVVASNVPKALAEGWLDAGQTWEPYTSQALANGFRLLASTADAPGIVTDVLMVKTDVLSRRKSEIRGLLKGLFRALEYRKLNESDAYAIMSAATGVAPGQLKGVIKEGNIFPGLAENKAAFTPSNDPKSLYSSGKFISDFFLGKDLITKPVDLDSVNHSEIMDSLN